MRKTNYWGTLFYNGVVIGIWPAAALAYILTFDVLHLPYLIVFAAIFALGWVVFVLAIMLLYHKLIVPRRRRKPQRQQKKAALH
jgi:hypothetical protein